MIAVGAGVGGGGLAGHGEVGAGGSVGVDDALGEQVGDGIAAGGLVGGEDVVEGAVFADDHDDVFDGSGGLGFASGFLSGGRKRRSEVGDDREKTDANSKVLPGLGQETWCRHEFSS